MLLNKAVIDTSALFEILLVNYSLKVSPKDNLCKEVDSVFNGNLRYKNNYIEFYNSLKIFYSTSQAIGELHGLINSRLHFKDKLYEKFWEISIDYLKQKRLDEKLIELLTISENNLTKEMIFKIGYVDTGLIELAMKEELCIITKDRQTLRKYAKNMMINVIVLSEYLNY